MSGSRRLAMVLGSGVLAAPALVLPVRAVVAQARPAPDEEAVVAELTRISRLEARAEQVAGLDALLARLDRPTFSRAVVQSMRAELLTNQPSNFPLAHAAIEEAMRLAPNNSDIRLLASNIYTYTGDPGRAATLWIEVSRDTPALARRTDGYDLFALAERLSTEGLRDRADALLARMVEIAHPAIDTGVRSSAAASRVRESLSRGDLTGAADAMRQVVDYDQFLSLYVDRTFEPIWPAMDRWTDGDLDQALAASLQAHRSDWRRDGLKSAPPYASDLLEANAHEAVVELFAPLARDPAGDPFDRARLATLVANALVHLGQGDGAVALQKQLAEEPGADLSAKLTARANLAYTFLSLDRYDDAIAAVDRFRADAQALNGTGNREGLAQTEALRGCALAATGRMDEAGAEFDRVDRSLLRSEPSLAWRWLSCLGRAEAARRLMLESLADEDRRAWALVLLQPSTLSNTGEWASSQYRFLQAVRNDTEVRAAADQVGRLLRAPVGERLPNGFDPRG